MIRTGLPRLLLALLVAGILLGVFPGSGGSARAVQPDQPSEATTESGATPAVGTGELDLRVTAFGIGNRPRPGDWVAIRVEVLNRSDKLREAIIRLEIPDADGDRTQLQRTIVPDPNARRTVWLYGRLPFNATAGRTYELAAYEAVERPAGDGGRIQYTAGRKIGGTAVMLGRTGTPVAPTAALIGVVGPRTVGLEQYTLLSGARDFTPTGHERIEVVGGLTVADIPDRWMGLMALEALVWTASGPEGEPRDLNESQAEAIREWVARGGHLVVVLPSIGQGWLGRRDHLLAEIMPAAAVQPLQGVSLEPYRRLLRKNAESPLPQSAVVNVLEPDPGAGAYAAMRILTGPDGETVAIRRLHGTGAVTVVGLDLTSRSLQALGGVDADRFWNRILGKRIEIPSKEDAERIGQSGWGFAGSRSNRWFDRDIAGEIAKTGHAAAGLLLAFFVFLLYWLGAGPVGYFVLRQRGYKHHSWVLFVVMAGVFTAVAWGGANLVKQRTVEAQHLTFLDHVYGQPNQRARIWMNLFLPEYGEQRVSIGDPRTARSGSAELRHALSPWAAPGSGVTWSAFPDARGYAVDSRSPDTITAPSRATVRQFQADWAGPPEWRMPSPVLPEGDPVQLGSEIVLVRTDTPRAGERPWQLHGQLVHQLPGALENVLVIVVLRQEHLEAPPPAALVRVHAVRPAGKWEPGDVLDLNSETAAQSRLTAQQFFGGLLGGGASGMTQEEESTATSGRDAVDRFTALALYSVLEPPAKESRQTPGTETVIARRQAAQTWDLGRWFTQPCVIIIGHVTQAESPVPVHVDGRRVPTKGRTVVRWIYPLPDDPPRQDGRLDGP